MLNSFYKIVICTFIMLSLLPASVFAGNEKISVFVSIQPQAYFVHRIVGGLVDVEVLVPPGKSPATYGPDPAQILKLARARALFTIGVPFESALLPKIKTMSPRLEIVDTTRDIPLRRFGSETDEDNPMEFHDHAAGAFDPHIWMSPVLVKKQADTICDALGAIVPEHENILRRNLNAFKADLDALDSKIHSALAPVRGETIFVFHPVFGYFADAYALKQISVERGGKAPRGKELAAFIREAREKSVHVIFVQPQFDKSVAMKIASAINGAVVPLDPLAYDYIENLSEMALIIKGSFSR